MGIKTAITQNDLPKKYQSFELIETQDGVNHSVYLLEDKYVLKLLENTSIEIIENEKKLLNALETLLVPKIVDIFVTELYSMVFYTQVSGTSVPNPTIEHIKEIAHFLNNFHSISKHLHSSNRNIYTSEYFEEMIKKANYSPLTNYFKSIDCELQNDGIIHGDLFYDNAKFINDTLSGVYDFVEASQGDFTFELAVVCISWCFDGDMLNKTKVKTLLKNYNTQISFEEFVVYIQYALLYYATQRYLHNRDYKALLLKLEKLKS